MAQEIVEHGLCTKAPQMGPSWVAWLLRERLMRADWQVGAGAAQHMPARPASLSCPPSANADLQHRE
jgi:hypothetical protein